MSGNPRAETTTGPGTLTGWPPPPRRELDALAGLLAYPRPGYREAAGAAWRELEATRSAAAVPLAAFAAMVEQLTLAEVEELYTRTFDLNPACALDVGWHLYGEQYERGAFLAGLRDLLRATGVSEGTELPDHLPRLLLVLGRLEPERAARLAALVRPALAKMLAALAGKGNPYQLVLEAVAAACGLAAPLPEPTGGTCAPSASATGGAARGETP